MQSESGSYLMQHPPYPGVYEPVWGPNPISSLSFTNAEENFFGDYISNSSSHEISNDVIDDMIMDPRFDLTSSISEFKNLQLNSPNGPFPAAPSCESEFDPHLFSYPTPPQQTMPQHFYDVLPPLENHIYSPEEASDSDSSIQTPQSITSPTAEIHNWPQTPDRANEQFLPATGLPRPSDSSCCSSFNFPLNTQVESQLIMNMDDQMNYAVEPFSTNDKFLVETSHFSLPRNSIKTEPNYVNRDTWPTQPMISPLEVGCGNPRHPHILQQPIASSSLQRSPQKVVKKRHRQRRRKGADKEKTVHLWEFIRDILLEPQHCPSLMKWEDRGTGVFRFVKSDTVASMWGKKKQNPKMTYEKLSRAMRYYYNRGILERVDGRRLVYKFGPNAHGWKESESHTTKSDSAKANSLQGDTASATSRCDDVTSAPLAPCKMENNEALDDVIDTQSPSATLLPSADVLLGKPTTHV